ncbi:MAG: tetratricopeptide repeat protein, partial [Gammaproteobacteria bacterium]|nr:tetratricopeptide repeat protein [Gammaproteobacteria bacterium]
MDSTFEKVCQAAAGIGLAVMVAVLAGCARVDMERDESRAPAAPVLTGVVDIAPALAGTPAARALLMKAREQLGDVAFDEAAATLERALTIVPDDAAVWHGLGVLAYRRGDLEQALVSAAQARSRSSNVDQIAALAWRLTGQV